MKTRRSCYALRRTIRVATPADAGKITSVINLAFRFAEEFFIDGNRITQTEVEDLLAKGDFLLAETDDHLNGCVYVELRGERSYLGLLLVDPERQQGGLGSLLMNEAENYCRERGSQLMDIVIVSLREELPAYYRKRGYLETVRLRFPQTSKRRCPATLSTWLSRYSG